MRNKKSKFWKPILKWSIILYAINQLTFPIGVSAVIPVYPSAIRADRNKVQSYQKIPKNFTALDYVNLANMILNNHSKGEGVCRDYSKETFNVYKKLIKQNERKDLEESIRMVAGSFRSWKKIGHWWIVVKHKGKWVDYDSVLMTPDLRIEGIKGYSKVSLEYKGIPDAVKLVQSFNGKLICYPTLSSLKDGGLIKLLSGGAYSGWQDFKYRYLK